MRLNTPNVTDGMIRLTVNGALAIERNDVLWRVDDSVNIEGINIASWYGGSNPTWSPSQNMYTYLKNFRMYYDGPVDNLLARSAGKDGPQVVINEVIDEAP